MEKIKAKFKERQGFAKWLPLIVLSVAMMIIIIDTTVLNVSIRNILNDLNTTVQNIQWVISAYALTLAALTVTGGRLGDLFGRKRMFIVGALLFAAGSLVTSVAPNIMWVIIGNAIIEGIGAALMMPATSSLLVNEYRGKDRALAFAIWGAVAASAASFGPILGGWLTTNYSWRWAFRINLVVVALLLIGARFLHEARDKSEKIELDGVGILLSSVGLTSVVYGLIESSSYGWFTAKAPFAIFGHSFAPFSLSIAPIAIAFGLALLAFFALFEHHREQKGHTPLVSLSLFANKQFTAGSVTTAFQALAMSGLIFSTPIFYQSVLHFDAFKTGLGLLPMSLAVMIGAPLALKLTKRFTPKQVIQIGFLVSTLGSVLLYFAFSVDATVWSFAPGLALFGLGLGFGFSQLSNLTLSAVSVDQSGEASGVNNTLRQVGQSFGSAIIGAALIATISSSVVKNVETSSELPAQLKPAVVAQVKAAGSNIEFASAEDHKNVPPVIAKVITDASEHATVEGNKTAMSLTIFFTIATLLTSVLLPNIRDLETGKSATEKPVAVH
ncbi:MAG: DHA2 family efflux MFS transporter permease subunit [Candidatus Saccharimonadales bacterium]